MSQETRRQANGRRAEIVANYEPTTKTEAEALWWRLRDGVAALQSTENDPTAFDRSQKLIARMDELKAKWNL